MALLNMGRQDKELRPRLEDAEKLRLYAKAAGSERRALEDSLDKAKSQSRYWEWKAKEAKEEAQVDRLATVAAGDTKVKAKGDLARVKDALAVEGEARAVAEEAKHKVESEVVSLKVDRTSLLLELGMAKDKVSSLQSQADKDKEAMEEEY